MEQAPYSKFFEGGITRLAASVVTKDSPAYVQFYVTARCNLTCEQCNVIYANADQEEATTDQCRKIAENLARIGPRGAADRRRPFVRGHRRDRQAMIDNGVHPRLRANGLATRKQLEAMTAIGAHDISISLDSPVPGCKTPSMAASTIPGLRRQGDGGHQRTFPKVVCGARRVLSRAIEHRGVEFATAIGWWVSLVPAHATRRQAEPRGFSTFDRRCGFPRAQGGSRCSRKRRLRNASYNLYDSDEYLDDIYRFICGEPVQWRKPRGGYAMPQSHFAIQPNGDMAVCDYACRDPIRSTTTTFPPCTATGPCAGRPGIAERCTGCMQGFPEITISSRFFVPMLARAKLFLASRDHRRLRRLSVEKMTQAARDIALRTVSSSQDEGSLAIPFADGAAPQLSRDEPASAPSLARTRRRCRSGKTAVLP